MRWKDSDAGEGADPEKSDPYYEDDGYASFKAKAAQKATMLSGNPVRYLYWGLGIAVTAAVVLLIILSAINEPVDVERFRELEQKIARLEKKLVKYEGMDEKVTRIWEQAKAFETFKTRFDRSEASMSLRMDHLAMSLDALQKKTDKTLLKVSKLESRPLPKGVSASPPTAKKAASKKSSPTKTHTVVAGDTLYGISRRYGISMEKLKSINKLTDGAVLNVGQRLKVSSPGN